MSQPGFNNNAYGKERLEAALAKLTEAAWTIRQLVYQGVFPNEEIGRRVLNKARKRGKVHRPGDVNIRGNNEFLWYCGFLKERQHEAEMSEIQLGIKADEVRRLFDVDRDLRMDGIIISGDQQIPWEHECSGKLNIRQIVEKMNRYGNQAVLWTCRNPSWLDKLTRFAISDKHLFTTYELAVEDFHGDIWVDRHGNRFCLPLGV